MAPVKIYDIPVRILRILEDNCKFFVLKMVRHQTPGIDFHCAILGLGRQTAYKIIAIDIAAKYLPSLNTPAHDMVQHARGI